MSRLICSLLFVILLQSCATRKKTPTVAEKKNFETKLLKYKAVESIIWPGKVVMFKMPFQYGFKSKLYCGGKPVPFFVEDEELRAYIAESYFSKRKRFNCRLKWKKRQKIVARFKVRNFAYKQERLRVDKKRLFLNKKDLKRVKKEQVILNKLYAEMIQRPLFEEPFTTPLDSFITSYYGTRRIYNNKKKGQHLGTDFRAQVGVPIPVANKGKVVLAQNLFFTGYTVIVNHGLGIFTVYGHLSKLKTSVGEYVSQGSIIGLSGATGRVSGPHLHWGVKIQGNWVDGFSLVEQGI